VEGEDVKKIREKLGLTRDELAQFLCLSGYQSMMNVETGFRRPARFAAKVLSYLNSIPKQKAIGLIEELNRHEPK
jgi:DNA-binding transcriptional regulator YiaG